jgi:hypothetical protein
MKPAQSNPNKKPNRPAPMLPHERDQAEGAVSPNVDPVIAQAKRDIDAGLVDTDMRATPGLDAQRRQDLVQGEGAVPTALRSAPPARQRLVSKTRRRKPSP